MYIPDMAINLVKAGLVSFPSMQTPLGRLNFGAHLRGTQGTGLDKFRVCGMYAIVFIRWGGGIYRDVRGLCRRLVPGDVIAVFPELGHQYGPEAGDVWDEVFVAFDGPAFDAWRVFGLDPVEPVWHVGLPEQNAARLLKFLAFRMGSLSDACVVLGKFHALLANWIALRPRVAKVPVWLESARHALAGSSGALSIQGVARAAGMNHDSFRRAFRTVTGETPAAFRRRQRLAQAANLLRRKDLTLDQIASTLGFSDAFHLSKLFKRQYSQSPSAYREQLSQGSPSTF